MSQDSQRGVALLMAIIALLLVTAVGVGMMALTDTETGINANFRDAEVASYAARAGLEEARDRLRPSNPSPLTPPPTLPSNSGGVIYILNPNSASQAITPWTPGTNFFDDELCHENFYSTPANPGYGMPCQAAPSGSWYSSAPSTSPGTGTAAALTYKWVRVTQKANGSMAPYFPNGSGASATVMDPVCWDGGHEVAVSTTCAAGGYSQVYVLTSLAVTDTGSRRMAQMEVAMDPPANFPAALTIAGTGQTQCQIQGPPHPQISGVDNAPGVPPNTGVAGFAASSGNAYNGCVAGLKPGSDVTGAPPYNAAPSARNTSVTGPPLDPKLDPAQGLPAYLSSLISMADNIFTNAIPPGADLGSPGSPKITVVNGSTQIGAISGTGVLIVTGNQAQLQIDGNIHWNGVIILDSTNNQAQYQLQSGNGSIDGALFIAAPAGAQIQYQQQGGQVNYNSTNISNAFSRPLKVIALRDRMY